ncbi:hypothetical protein C5F47_06485 [Nitrosopumilus cobalaminigenes]|uniref:Uncharacterized protein n=1 Tax=Nitrosopumilus cobalaminigenes TaxID=1470066 RepID=A0A7D5R0S0_9ARCH|nr:hypothetical protein [Nitrosopumilus cobalaminigenes]QLH03218.1 hypothetical protein C5F47_06485 [Nitrosopumilus cobalaminigenes]
MNVIQRKLEVETSKEIILQTILKNKENLDTNLIADAIKDYVKNHENYDFEKKDFWKSFQKNEKIVKFRPEPSIVGCD